MYVSLVLTVLMHEFLSMKLGFLLKSYASTIFQILFMVLVVCFNKANGKYDKGLFPRSKNDSLFMHTFIKVQHLCN